MHDTQQHAQTLVAEELAMETQRRQAAERARLKAQAAKILARLEAQAAKVLGSSCTSPPLASPPLAPPPLAPPPLAPPLPATRPTKIARGPRPAGVLLTRFGLAAIGVLLLLFGGLSLLSFSLPAAAAAFAGMAVCLVGEALVHQVNSLRQDLWERSIQSLLLVLALGTTAAAAPLLDAEFASFFPVAYGEPQLEARSESRGDSAAQIFTPSRDGLLTALDLRIRNHWTRADAALVSVWSLAGDRLGRRLAYGVVEPEQMAPWIPVPRDWQSEPWSPGWTTVSFAVPPLLHGGASYVWTASPLGTAQQQLSVWFHDDADAPRGGYVQGSTVLLDHRDDRGAHPFAFHFRTWLDPDFGPPPPPPPPVLGDLDGDGRVDLADYAILKANFGRSGDVSVPEPSVPEPSGRLLALSGLFAAIGLLVIRRHVRHR